NLATLPPDEPGVNGQLVAGETHGLGGDGLCDAGKLEHHPARLHHGHPALGVALAGPHPGLGGLLRVGLVGEDVDPDLAAALDVAGDGDTCGLDLTARDPTGLDCLEAEVTEVDLGATLGQPSHAAAVLLAVLHLLGAKHRRAPPAPGELPVPPA